MHQIRSYVSQKIQLSRVPYCPIQMAWVAAEAAELSAYIVARNAT